MEIGGGQIFFQLAVVVHWGGRSRKDRVGKEIEISHES